MTDHAPLEATPGDDSDAPVLPILTRPRDGVPALVAHPDALARAAALLATGTGPIAVDTERAHGFRYTNRAYLIQLRRAGAGTFLIDPVPLAAPDGPGFRGLRAALDGEWILHAASQDLPCLAEIELLPTRLFDTELAARLLGYPRVALGTLTEELLGIRLLKEHSAADWSRRPFPDEWLAYAALDVELLADLRERLGDELVAQGKDGWAAEEFAALVAGADTPHEPRHDRWRRTSGIHTVKTPLGMGIVRELWQTRDEIAARLDKAPGRILGDEAITQLAAQVTAQPVRVDRGTLRGIERFNRREARRFETSWLAAVQRVGALPRSALPPVATAADGPPSLRSWAKRKPEAAARWESMRPAVTALAETLKLPAENLIQPETLRRVAWEPAGLDREAVDQQLAASGARAWQRELVLDIVLAGIAQGAAAS